MHTKTIPLTALLACVGSSTACNDTADTDADLRVVMHTPAADDLTAPDSEHVDDIRLTFYEVQLHHVDEGWVAVEPADEDAEVYFGEMPLALAHATLPEGEYDQLRLLVDEAEIYIDARAYPLDIPSGMTSGFKIHGNFCVHHHDNPDGKTEKEGEPERDDGRDDHELILRWNTDEGIRYSGERGYWLVPSVQIEHAPGCEVHDHDDDA